MYGIDFDVTTAIHRILTFVWHFVFVTFIARTVVGLDIDRSLFAGSRQVLVS